VKVEPHPPAYGPGEKEMGVAERLEREILLRKIQTLVEGESGLTTFHPYLRREYARFMALKVFANDTEVDQDRLPALRPSGPIDHIWHCHMSLPRSYKIFCESVTKYRQIIDHSPSTEFHANRKTAYVNTIEQYVRVFGELNLEFWDIPNEEEPEYNVTVKTLIGSQYLIPVKSTMRVLEFKERIEVMQGAPPCQQRLIFNGIQLDDVPRLGEYKIEEGAVVHMVIRLRGC